MSGVSDRPLAEQVETGTGPLPMPLGPRLVAEGLGTAFLLIAVSGLPLVIHGCVRTGRAAAVPYAVGVWIGGAYFFTSSTSFVNPAVTVARTLSDTFAGIAPSSAPMFIVAQLIGAAAAVGLIVYLFPRR